MPGGFWTRTERSVLLFYGFRKKYRHKQHFFIIIGSKPDQIIYVFYNFDSLFLLWQLEPNPTSSPNYPKACVINHADTLSWSTLERSLLDN